MASDRDDLVIGANRAARRMFGLQNETFDIPLPRHEILAEEAPTNGLMDAERDFMSRPLADLLGVSAAGGSEAERSVES